MRMWNPAMKSLATNGLTLVGVYMLRAGLEDVAESQVAAKVLFWAVLFGLYVLWWKLKHR
jgi:hypothetical protein